MTLYQLFVTDGVVDFIVAETNRFASQDLASQTVTQQSRLNVWHPTDQTEMKTFSCIIILMGINPLPEISPYWSKSKLYQGKLVKDSMDRDSSTMLMCMQHFYDNSESNASQMRKVKFLQIC